MSYRRLLTVFSLLSAAGLGFCATECHAQYYSFGPVAPPFTPPVLSYRPALPAAYTSTYSATVVSATPTVTVSTYRAPIVAAPVLTKQVTVVRPVVYPVYRPAYVPVPVPVRPVYVRPKVYVPGQPVRNTIRAVTP